MMIAIVILGLGLVMVATMFPVAWTRARELSETATEQSISIGARALVANAVRPATVSPWLDANPPGGGGPQVVQRLTLGGLLGDLFWDPQFTTDDLLPHLPINYTPGQGFYSDTRVHALNMGNFPVNANDEDADNGQVPEDLWEIEGLGLEHFGSIHNAYPGFLQESMRNTPFDIQIPLWQRVHPPADAPAAESDPEYAKKFADWEQRLATRRFALAVLHRLKAPLGPAVNMAPTAQQLTGMQQAATEAMGQARVFDFYYVTLRRPNSTNRYARQDPAAVADPNSLGGSPAAVRARPASEDLAFPVAWRVEVEFQAGSVVPRSQATGAPTEMIAPRLDLASANPDAARMVAQMFPEGTRAVDETTGRIYRVVRRRLAADGLSAALTLDRELYLEDLDYSDNDQWQPNGALESHEWMRTVWVFPPPVDRENSSSEILPDFRGNTPVVNIEVHPLTLSPAS